MTETIRIHPATDSDKEVVTRIFDAADPAWATSAVEYRRGPKPRPTNVISLLAEVGGRPVGAARANEALDGLIPRPGGRSLRVSPDKVRTDLARYRIPIRRPGRPARRPS